MDEPNPPKPAVVVAGVPNARGWPNAVAEKKRVATLKLGVIKLKNNLLISILALKIDLLMQILKRNKVCMLYTPTSDVSF